MQDGCTDQYISLVVSNNGNSYCCQYSHGNNIIKDYCLSMTLKKNNVHWNYILLKVVWKKPLWKGLPAVLNSIGFRGNSIELYYISIDLIPARFYGIFFFWEDICERYNVLFACTLVFSSFHSVFGCELPKSFPLAPMGSCALSRSSVTTDLAALCGN